MNTAYIPNVCPHCGAALNKATNHMTDEAPRPGAWALCVGCAGLSKLDEDLKLVKATDEEYNRLPKGAKLQIAQAQMAIKGIDLGKTLNGDDYLSKKN